MFCRVFLVFSRIYCVKIIFLYVKGHKFKIPTLWNIDTTSLNLMRGTSTTFILKRNPNKIPRQLFGLEQHMFSHLNIVFT